MIAFHSGQVLVCDGKLHVILEIFHISVLMQCMDNGQQFKMPIYLLREGFNAERWSFADPLSKDLAIAQKLNEIDREISKLCSLKYRLTNW